jgi:hypothetical protein
VNQNYFTIYDGNGVMLGKITAAEIRQKIVGVKPWHIEQRTQALVRNVRRLRLEFRRASALVAFSMHRSIIAKDDNLTRAA